MMPFEHLPPSEHLDDEVLIRALDDELASDDRALVDAHLAACEACKARERAFGIASVRIESMVASVSVEDDAQRRRTLVDDLRSREADIESVRRHSRLRTRIEWGMAIAASLALGVMFLPHGGRQVKPGAPLLKSQYAVAGTFALGGETFYVLPYSNTDLPISSSHVVQMEVPVSSLASAGVVVAPISDVIQNPDRAVLADVLLGDDGEPVGVHVIESE